MRRALPLFFALFALLSLCSVTEALPGSEVSATEARTLMTVASIVEDGDLDLGNQYSGQAWRETYADSALEPAALSTDGRLHERQGVALPLLLAPAWAAGGLTGVRLLLCALLALALCVGVALGRRLVPDPWPLRGAGLLAVSAATLGAAGAVSAAIPAAALLGLGGLCALRVRDTPTIWPTAGAALCAAALPWLDPWLLLPAAGLALAVFRWLRRRRRGLAGFVALELVLVSGVVYVTINDLLFGGLTPGAAALPGSRGAVLDALVLALSAPALAIVGVAGWRLWVSRRDRLVLVADDQIDVEVAGTFLLALAASCVAAALGSTSPELALAALPAAAGLLAWGLQIIPRAGVALAALTAGASLAAMVG